MPPLVVRRARTEDLDDLVLLWREMWEFHVPFDPRFEITAAADLVMGKWFEETLQNDRAVLFVAEEKPGSALGYCHARNTVAGRFWRKQGYSEFLERLRREL